MARIVYYTNAKTVSNNTFEEILNASSFIISVENEIISTTNNLRSAVALLMLTDYNFNLAYNSKMLSTLTFIQKVLKNIDTFASAPQKVVRCLYNLNTVISNRSSAV